MKMLEWQFSCHFLEIRYCVSPVQQFQLGFFGKSQKLQFLKCPLGAGSKRESIHIDSHVKLSTSQQK